jgi:hypothetical protein
VIVLDTDILILDLRFPRDPRHFGNRRFLEHGKKHLSLGMTCHSMLEVIGKLSFSVTPADIPKLAVQIPIQYGLKVAPDLDAGVDYASCSVGEVLMAIQKRMSLGDAVHAVQIEKFCPAAACLITWNAKHYQGKLNIPALTPEEWWQQHQPSP